MQYSCFTDYAVTGMCASANELGGPVPLRVATCVQVAPLQL